MQSLGILDGWSFPIDVDEETGKIKSVSDNDAVKQSVNMILKTQILERKIFSQYGSNIRSFMFDIVNSGYVSSFRKSVEDSILSCEPHVKSIEVSVNASSGPVSEIVSEIEYLTDILPTREKIYKTISVSDENE